MTSTEHILRAKSTYDQIAEIIGRKPKMLVVDDSEVDVLLLQRKVKVPVEWAVAYSVKDAIALLQQNDYFLIWVDLAMPGQGGSALMKWMSEQKDEHGQSRYMRRVVHTGSTKSEELDKALRYGPIALMSKDFTDEHFLQLLHLVNMPQPLKQYAAVA